MQRLLANYEVIHGCLVSRAILYDIRLKADLLAGRVFHKRDFNVTCRVCDKGAVESAPGLRENLLCNRNAFTQPFFYKKEVPI